MTLADRFYAKVGPRLPTGCMEWQACKSPNGYGLITGRRGNKHRNVLAHRAAWMLVHGDIPDGMVIMHACDNPSCVNHEHLRLGTQKDNIADMIAKKRQGRSPLQKLFPADIDAIHKMRSEGLTHRAIASRLGVSSSRICMHLNGGLRID